MDRHLIDRLETFVKNEGFEQVEINRASTSHTLSAVKDETRLVLHVADGVTVPTRAEAVRSTPADLIAVRPIVPGFTAAITGLPEVSGGGGGAAATQDK